MEEKKKYVLAVDCGTQSLRTLIFDDEGHLVAKVKDEYEPYYSKEAGAAEKNPELYWKSFLKCLGKLRTVAEDIFPDLLAITVTTIRGVGVFLDENGEIVRDSFLFFDERVATCEKPLPMHYRAALNVVQMSKPVEAVRKQSKTNWVQEFEPENWAKTKHYIMLSGYFHYKLTGRIIDSITNQIGHIPFDYKKKTWEKKGGLHDLLFPIEREKLSELVDAGDVIGQVSDDFASEFGLPKGLKVVTAGSDKGCETLGVGCLDPTSVSISFGTMATIQTTVDKYMEVIPFLPPYPAMVRGKYNPEIGLFRGYWMIRWFKKEFMSKDAFIALDNNKTPEQFLNEKLEGIPVGADGLMLQPYWEADMRFPDARGSIIGFNYIHTRYHIYRAIIEGINYALLEGLEKIEKKTKTKVEKVYVSGGGSSSAIICQITADMFNRPVVRGETYEASGLGAAINAFVAMGVYGDYREAVKCMTREAYVFKPNEKNAKKYDKLFNNVYKKVYSKLIDLYKTMSRIESEDL